MAIKVVVNYPKAENLQEFKTKQAEAFLKLLENVLSPQAINELINRLEHKK